MTIGTTCSLSRYDVSACLILPWLKTATVYDSVLRLSIGATGNQQRRVPRPTAAGNSRRSGRVAGSLEQAIHGF